MSSPGVDEAGAEDSSNKVALVTAGSAGLGAAIVRTLALDAGMRVAINYNTRADRADALVKDLEESFAAMREQGAQCSGKRFIAFQADVSDRNAVAELVSSVHASMGRLDVVVSNAGWTKVRDFMDLDDNMDESDWDKCFQVNVKSHIWLFHAARPYLEPSEGAFIATASVAGIKPSGSSVPYAVTKAALIHLIKSLAIIAAPSIRVNSVSPGILLTDWGLSFPQEKLDAAKQQNRLKRFAAVADVAAQVRTFALSRSVTGQNAVIDAGFSV